MPEFHLDFRSKESIKTYSRLDAFTQGYIEAMFFTCGGELGDDLNDATFDELAPTALAKIVADCTAFQAANREDIDEACDNGRINGYDEASAGRDFWYTRNGHGVGFFDRDLGEVGDKLDKACAAFKSIDLYRGDDGGLYLA